MDGSWKDHVRPDEPSLTQPNQRNFFPSMKPVTLETNQNQVSLSPSPLLLVGLVCQLVGCNLISSGGGFMDWVDCMMLGGLGRLRCRNALGGL